MKTHDAKWAKDVVAQSEALAASWSAPAPEAEPRRLGSAEIAGYIDHTILKADATPDAVARICAEAAEHHFCSVCINSGYVAFCAELLRGSGVLVGSTAGFPLGAMAPEAKAAEARVAVSAGAGEVDMVIAVGRLKAGDLATVYEDIAGVAQVCHDGGAVLKVILETCLLTDAEKIAGCLVLLEAGADYAKTSTGFSTGGATLSDVALLRHMVGPGRGVKAAGGIRTYGDAIAMIAAGASRIGASAGLQILAGAEA